jgi:hypothetical protein
VLCCFLGKKKLALGEYVASCVYMFVYVYGMGEGFLLAVCEGGFSAV